MQIRVEIPSGTLMLVKAEQIFIKGKKDKITPVEVIVVRRLEESYQQDPLTPKLIDIQKSILKGVSK